MSDLESIEEIIGLYSKDPESELEREIQLAQDAGALLENTPKFFFTQPDKIIFKAVDDFEREYTRLLEADFLNFNSQKSFIPQMIPKFLITNNKIDKDRFQLNNGNQIILQRTTLVNLLVKEMMTIQQNDEIFIGGPRGIGKSHALAYFVLKCRMQELKENKKIKVFYINSLKYFMEDSTIKYFLREVIYFAGPHQKNIRINELNFTRSEFLKSQQDKKMMLQEIFEKLINIYEHYNFYDVLDLLDALIQYFRRHHDYGSFVLIIDQYNEKLVNGKEKNQIYYADLTNLFPFRLIGTSEMFLPNKRAIRLNQRFTAKEAFRFIESRLQPGELQNLKDSEIYQELQIRAEIKECCEKVIIVKKQMQLLNEQNSQSEQKEKLKSDIKKVREYLEQLNQQEKELHISKKSQSQQQINQDNTIFKVEKAQDDKEGESFNEKKTQKKVSRQCDPQTTKQNDLEQNSGIMTRQMKKLKQTKNQPLSKRQNLITIPIFTKEPKEKATRQDYLQSTIQNQNNSEKILGENKERKNQERNGSIHKFQIIDDKDLMLDNIIVVEELKQTENKPISKSQRLRKMKNFSEEPKPKFKAIDDKDLVLETNIVENLTEYHPLDLHSLLECVIKEGSWEQGIEEFRVQKYKECQAIYYKYYPPSENSQDRYVFFELIAQLSFDFKKKGIANVNIEKTKRIKNENFFYLNEKGNLEFSSHTIGNCILQFLFCEYKSFREILDGPGFQVNWKLCKEMEKFDQVRNDVTLRGHALERLVELSFLRLQNRTKLKIGKNQKFITFKVKGKQSWLLIPKNFDVVYFDQDFILPKSQSKEISMTIFTPKSLRFDHIDFILYLYSKDHREFLFIQVTENIYSHKPSDKSVNELMMKPGIDSFSKALKTYKDIDHKFIWLGRYNSGISEEKYKDAIWNRIDEDSLVLEVDDFIAEIEKVTNLD